MGNTNHTASKMKRHPALRYFLAFILVFSLWVGYDYFTSLSIVDAKPVKIIADPQNPNRKQMQISVVSSFPPHPFIPNSIRYLFRLQPKLCFVNPDGSELINEDVATACFVEEDEYENKEKLHVIEKSNFLVPFYLKPARYQHTQQFYKTLLNKKGIWIQIRLAGFIVPPAVSSNPYFLSVNRDLNGQ